MILDHPRKLLNYQIYNLQSYILFSFDTVPIDLKTFLQAKQFLTVQYLSILIKNANPTPLHSCGNRSTEPTGRGRIPAERYYPHYRNQTYKQVKSTHDQTINVTVDYQSISAIAIKGDSTDPRVTVNPSRT